MTVVDVVVLLLLKLVKEELFVEGKIGLFRRDVLRRIFSKSAAI